ncbi:MAG: OsmC family peroxiredoxin [Proteobacteria bacterium]|nr:OsmC family peroxiredoxin [Pseudomonadota bacterium]NDC25115.1 OsmC family peroxiredoxin [Pseudomonadota bacterium]NDD05253.1 OsmC family peroxiredoxin [Pseudomonadota bacterium]NDG28012.1 OsmC family peroxiredoxin [Pseudomonadota bacterium]
MSDYKAHIHWKNNGPDFVYETFDRTHLIKFPGGIELKGSSAPEFAGKKELANPEEMLAATLASCHMLTFLAVSAKSRLHLESYEDEPVATLDKNADGKMAVTSIRLNPKAKFKGEAPSPEKIQELHAKAHRNCFIANSLACKMAIEPRH